MLYRWLLAFAPAFMLGVIGAAWASQMGRTTWLGAAVGALGGLFMAGLFAPKRQDSGQVGAVPQTWGDRPRPLDKDFVSDLKGAYSDLEGEREAEPIDDFVTRWTGKLPERARPPRPLRPWFMRMRTDENPHRRSSPESVSADGNEKPPRA